MPPTARRDDTNCRKQLIHDQHSSHTIYCTTARYHLTPLAEQGYCTASHQPCRGFATSHLGEQLTWRLFDIVQATLKTSGGGNFGRQ